jgi:hypothetical protein
MTSALLLAELEVHYPASSTAGTLRASDSGYRSRETDSIGLQVYPPLLDTAFEIDRQISLGPGSSNTSATFGALRLINAEGQLDSLMAEANSDGRAVTVRRGRKLRDRRGIDLDPPYAALTPVFAGVAAPWFLSETHLEVPLRDARYFIEKPLQKHTYAGTGGYEGTEDMEGQLKPKLRGGRLVMVGSTPLGAPVANISPVLIDPVNLVWQVSDGPGLISAVYTGGDAANLTREPAVAELYTGTTYTAGPCPPGTWRACSRPDGLYVQLGSPVANGWQLTCSASGRFRTAGAFSTAAGLAVFLLTEELGVPDSLLDLTSFAALNESQTAACGDYWTGEVTGLDAVGPILASIGAKLVPTRDGRLRAMLLRPVPADAEPEATLTEADIVQVRVQQLPAPLDPPPYRWRVSWRRNYTVQQGSLDPDVTEARRQYIAQPEGYKTWTSAALEAAYQKPSDPEPVSTRLLQPTDAQAMANLYGALWGVPRRLYEVTVRIDVALARDLGQVIQLVYPLGELATGRVGLIVGEQIRSTEDTATLLVLV